MPTATANGLPVLRAEVVETYQGNWVAALDVDSNEVLSGALELVIGEITWRGTIVPGRSGLDGGHVRVIVETPTVTSDAQKRMLQEFSRASGEGTFPNSTSFVRKLKSFFR